MLDIREQTQKNFSSLSRIQKGLIQNILNEYEDYIFLSVNETAKALGVHKSTLVRLAQNIGFTGYTEFRAALQELYRKEITPGKKLGKTLSEVQDDNLYQQVIETEVFALKESLKTISTKDIQKAANLIINAKRVFICARGPQKALVELFEFRLLRFHLDVHTITEEGRAIIEKVHLLTSEDVLIFYSFIEVAKEQYIANSLAQEIGCPVIMITDTVAKEMVESITVTLAARRGPSTIYHTNIVPLAIQSAIVLQIAKILGVKALRQLDQLQDLRRKYGFNHSFIHKGDSQ